MKTELTVEESAHLIELGVDPKLASKCDAVMGIGEGIRGIIKRPDPKPIFTLTDILNIIPKEIESYYLNIKTRVDGYSVGYVQWDAYCENVRDYLDNEFFSQELIDALNQLLKWCLKNNKIKNE